MNRTLAAKKISIKIKEAYSKNPLKFGLTIFTLLIALFLLTAFLLTSNPNYCGSCHLMKKNYNSWLKSSHSNFACLDCHGQRGWKGLISNPIRILSYFFNYFTFKPSSPLSSITPNENCIYCHESILKRVKITSNIKVSHEEFTFSGYYCTDCHSDIAHQIKGVSRNYPNMDRCFNCHNNKKASSKCSLCHLLPAKEIKITGSAKSSYSLLHKEKKYHGLGNQKNCPICHSNNFCLNCHRIIMPHPDNWPLLHSQAAQQSKKECLNCHRSSYCFNCHQLEMPHSEKFVRQHGSIALERKKICQRCHYFKTCEYCHIASAHHFVKKDLRLFPQ